MSQQISHYGVDESIRFYVKANHVIVTNASTNTSFFNGTNIAGPRTGENSVKMTTGRRPFEGGNIDDLRNISKI